MNWKIPAAVLAIVVLPVTGLINEPHTSAAIDQPAAVLTDPVLISKYDTLSQLQQQEQTYNQQIAELDLSLRFNYKMREITNGLIQNETGLQKLEADRADYKSARLAITELKIERNKLQEKAAVLRKQHRYDSLSTMMSQVIELQQQINAAEQELVQQ